MWPRHAVSLSYSWLTRLLILATVLLAGHPPSGEAHEDGNVTGARRQEVCLGFVVLPNGFVVLSGLPVSSAPGTTAGRQARATAAPPPLLGYTHGQEVVPPAGTRCVSLRDAGTLKWTAVGNRPAPVFAVEALQGAPTHGGRVSAAFALTVLQIRALAEATQVRLLARMPQHDRYVSGGHGPANDPEAQGLLAQPLGEGRYVVAQVDFTMSGPWLLEIHVQQGSRTHKAYFAVYVGEE